MKRLIFGGASAHVYEALSASGERVAFKLYTRRISDLPDSRARIHREGALAREQTLPGVARVRETNEVTLPSETQSRPFLVMDFIEGVDLEKYVEEHGAWAPGEVAHAGVELCLALERLHSIGVVHRDLKPANILRRTDNGGLVITDFGVIAADWDEEITQSGVLLGTRAWTAPEVLWSEDADTSRQRIADVWSLAATLYFLLHRSEPIPHRNPHIQAARMRTERPSFSPGVRPELRRTILAGLNPSPDRRATLAELRQALEDYLAMPESIEENSRKAGLLSRIAEGVAGHTAAQQAVMSARLQERRRQTYTRIKSAIQADLRSRVQSLADLLGEHVRVRAGNPGLTQWQNARDIEEATPELDWNDNLNVGGDAVWMSMAGGHGAAVQFAVSPAEETAVVAVVVGEFLNPDRNASRGKLDESTLVILSGTQGSVVEQLRSSWPNLEEVFLATFADANKL